MLIDRVVVKNFKSLRDINLPLSNLTLLTGINSSGKSSFIQALLLLKQNEERLFFSKRKNLIKLNDRFVTLGKKQNILYEEEISSEDILISLISGKNELNVKFNIDDLIIKSNIDELIDINLFYDDFQYISTNRIEPSNTYDISDEEVDRNLIGFRGEFTAHYLAKNRHKKLEIEALKHKNAKTMQLLENVSLWLSEISSGVEVKATLYEDLQSASLSYSYTYGGLTTSDYSPFNVGFGLTYSLPIIVAILKAKRGDLIIIENPESHLHPSGQSKMAQLCAIASANGVQIIVETHSDHFLNGLRVATKKGVISSNQSQIYYFRKEENSIETIVDSLNIDENGKINQDWPKGFFDEYENLLDELLW